MKGISRSIVTAQAATTLPTTTSANRAVAISGAAVNSQNSRASQKSASLGFSSFVIISKINHTLGFSSF